MSVMTEGSFNDLVTVVEQVAPQAITAGATGVLTGAIDMRNYRKVIGIYLSGTLGTSGTADFGATASATSGGTYAALGSAKNATQLAKATGDNKIVIVEVEQEDLLPTQRYVKFTAKAGTANSTSAVIVLGIPANRAEAPLLNNAAVVETI